MPFYPFNFFKKFLWNSKRRCILYANTLPMAEMILPQKSGQRKIHSLRVDLTPMVDLGFLLITFFMLTTTMAQPKAMQVNMPDNTDKVVDGTAFPEESTITLIPAGGHQCYYYNGLLNTADDMHVLDNNKVCDLLQAQQQHAAALPVTFSKNAHQLHVIIKPDNSSKYEDVVQMMDEMNILNIQFYTLATLTADEAVFIEKQ